MSHPNSQIIDQSWPLENLENAGICPYCDSAECALEYSDVQDWAFGCAPGKWNYWKCQNCGTLFLNPRPTRETIGQAYAVYYTHTESKDRNALSAMKTLIRNLCYLSWYGIKLSPRLPYPKSFYPLLGILRHRIASPSFIVQALNSLPKGKVIDVGCGDGQFLNAARQLGWSTLGIEMDPESAKVVRAAGHDLILGTYEALADFNGEVDCVICSHVLEHVHDPRAMLLAILSALKVGGRLLLTLPNAESLVLQAFKENWRGLEAPRHLAIPTFEAIVALGSSLGFETEATFVSRLETLDESLAIARLRGADMHDVRARMTLLQNRSSYVTEMNSDFINVIFKKTKASSELLMMSA